MRIEFADGEAVDLYETRLPDEATGGMTFDIIEDATKYGSSWIVALTAWGETKFGTFGSEVHDCSEAGSCAASEPFITEAAAREGVEAEVRAFYRGWGVE